VLSFHVAPALLNKIELAMELGEEQNLKLCFLAAISRQDSTATKSGSLKHPLAAAICRNLWTVRKLLCTLGFLP
jgi:hypothetical protein